MNWLFNNLCLLLGQKESSMQQDCVSKMTVPLSNKSVANLCFLRNYLSWEIYSFAPCLAVKNLMFDLFWFEVDIILKQSFFVIWTSFMIILHYAIMIDFKNITRWKNLTWWLRDMWLTKDIHLITIESGFNYFSS